MKGLDCGGATMEERNHICFSLVIFQRLSAILEKYSDEHFC